MTALELPTHRAATAPPTPDEPVNSQMQDGRADPDDTPSSPADNPSFAEIVNGRLTRRTMVGGGLAAAVGFFVGGPGASAAFARTDADPSEAFTAAATADDRFTERPELLGFTPIRGNTTDVITVPDGYTATPFLPWGTPIVAPFPEWRSDASNGPGQQARQIGMGHDGMHYFPMPGPTGSEHGIMVLNHEYTIDAQLFPDGVESWDDRKTRKSQNAHGVSVVEIRRTGGVWDIVRDSPYNRRITARTRIDVSGPAAGHPLLRTGYDRRGTRLRGTANNCSMGVTPWGTYLAAEENSNGYFHRTAPDAESEEQTELYDRYGYSEDGFGYLWATTDERFDTGQEPNEPNRFHWMVEIDPMDPDARPVKRTALGRFKHESAYVTEANDGRVVVYSGDDERGDYIYKFVGAKPWRDYTPGEGSPLDDGVLHVAVFDAGGTGTWEPLTLTNPALRGQYGDMGELLVKTRLASDLVGATRMDRPEWIALNPITKDVYCSLTNNSDRGIEYPTDAANPIEENPDGHIIRWREDGSDPAAADFVWDIFLIAGPDPYDPEDELYITPAGFGSPDGLWFDPDGRLWIQTDGGQPIDSNDQMLVCDPETGDLRRFLVGVNECEVTGVITTPDQRTMFVNIQHPGDDGGSDWPDKTGGLPRPATVIITKDDGGIIGT